MTPEGWVVLWKAIQPVKRIRQAIWLHKLRKASKSGRPIDLGRLREEADVNYSQIEGIVRHVLTTLGGIAVGAGWVNDAQATAIVGGVVAIVGAVWSVVQKRNP